MSPVNLGDLPSNQPAPTGLCQIKLGQAGGVNYSSAAQYQPIGDGAGGQMSISITPSRPGWWVVRGQTIWLALDAAWYYFCWYLNIVPTDADGWSSDYNHMCQHSYQGWMQSCIDTVWRLNAGVAYTARMYWGYSQAGTQQMYGAYPYTSLMGEFIGETVL